MPRHRGNPSANARRTAKTEDFDSKRRDRAERLAVSELRAALARYQPEVAHRDRLARRLAGLS